MSLSPPRILVLSASVGAGHLRAAEAVELALRQTVPEALVRNVDVLDFTNAAFRRIYGKAYLDLSGPSWRSSRRMRAEWDDHGRPSTWLNML